MSGDARDPGSAARPDHDPVLIWNGLVTRIRRSVGGRQDGSLAATTFAGKERPPDTSRRAFREDERSDEPSSRAGLERER